VSNAEEFGEWLSEVRGDMAVVVSERRPVPLYQHVLVGRTLYDLFAELAPTARELPGESKVDVNPALIKIARDESRFVRDDARRPRGKSGRGKRTVSYGSGAYGGAAHRSRYGGAGRRSRSFQVPGRPELVELLDNEALLPAIVFIFSRVGCDAAVRQLLDSGIRLTSRFERQEIVAIIERHVAGLSDGDLHALEFDRFAEALGMGVAAHHAGMLPAFKECVEEAFVRGLIKVVFATETLALGINMPARSVVLEKLVKFDGETHADVTPGEYTQLTGRAGRRGIDVEGHAVVLWQPGLDPRAVAGLASRRTYPLRSSFSPTYNMAVNLVAGVGRERARTLLEQSFAQFQSDRSVVGVARTLERNKQSIEAYWAAATCDLGDFREYAGLRAELADLEASAARERRSDRRAEALQTLLILKPGDIVRVPSGKNQGWAVIIDPGTRQDHQTPRPLVLTEERHVRRLSITDFPTPPLVGGRMKIGKHFNPKDAASRRNLAAALRTRLSEMDRDQVRRRQTGIDTDTQVRLDQLRAAVQRHPCHSCPDRDTHLRWAERAQRLERESARLEARMDSRSNTIANHFDKICLVLESLGYLTGDGGRQVSEHGRMLARIYAELDLVAAECIRAGVFTGLTHPQLAAVLAALVFEARRSDEAHRRPRMPDARSNAAMTEVRRIWHEISLAERDARLQRRPEPDIGFSEAAYGWAAGRTLAEMLDRSELTAGDFVRWVRQVTDFAGQIADAAGPGELRDTARLLVRSMRRGVVSYAPEMDADEGDDLTGADLP
jgi:ATP-dependent RNA helicase HelY